MAKGGHNATHKQYEKRASGSGSIRQVKKTKNGKEYTYWEGRLTTGYDPGAGKQKQRTISGKTKKEVAQKLRQLAAELDAGTYHEPCKLTVEEWLDQWAENYLVDVKPYTEATYRGVIKNHIKPAIGAIRLDMLDAHTIQSFYNSLGKETPNRKALSPKTVKNINGVLHRALQQAVLNQYLRFNPANAYRLPRVTRKELSPLDDDKIREFVTAIKDHKYETLYMATMFTGMREGEALGLMWDCVDFGKGQITINKQLQREKKKNGQYMFLSTKNGKSRRIAPAPWVMELLREHKAQQEKQKQALDSLWEDSGLVFTNEYGRHLALHTVYKQFKEIVRSIDMPDTRFHDLRHTFAIASIRAGDDIKTIQENLGHATSAFTLDVYGHVTEQMRRESANRMESYIDNILQLKGGNKGEKLKIG